LECADLSALSLPALRKAVPSQRIPICSQKVFRLSPDNRSVR